MKKTKPNEIEKRTFCGEIRVEGEDQKIVGHAAVFEEFSKPMWGFVEKIAVGAFDDVLDDDVRALFNHDANLILGRTKAGTLKLSVDSIGLRYEITTPDTQLGTDLIKSMKRGDINQSSFAFRVLDDDWQQDDEGRTVRTILKIKSLLDVSPVTYPAYDAADSTVRSFDEFKGKYLGDDVIDYEKSRRELRIKILDLEPKY